MTKMRFFTSFEVTISLLFCCEGVGGGRSPHPTPSQSNSTQGTVIQIRRGGEESNAFYRATTFTNI